jgi:hypothetical protein
VSAPHRNGASSQREWELSQPRRRTRREGSARPSAAYSNARPLGKEWAARMRARKPPGRPAAGPARHIAFSTKGMGPRHSAQMGSDRHSPPACWIRYEAQAFAKDRGGHHRYGRPVQRFHVRRPMGRRKLTIGNFTRGPAAFRRRNGRTDFRLMAAKIRRLARFSKLIAVAPSTSLGNP